MLSTLPAYKVVWRARVTNYVTIAIYFLTVEKSKNFSKSKNRILLLSKISGLSAIHSLWLAHVRFLGRASVASSTGDISLRSTHPERDDASLTSFDIRFAQYIICYILVGLSTILWVFEGRYKFTLQ